MYLLHRKKYGIYANISLFHSYSEVTVATRTQSVSRSDGHCSHPDPVRIQSRWWRQLYSPECQQKPCQLDELQKEIPSEGLIIYKAIGTKP